MWVCNIMPSHLPPLSAWYWSAISWSRLNASPRAIGEQVGARIVGGGQLAVPRHGVVELVEIRQRADGMLDQLEEGVALRGGHVRLAP